MGARSRPSAARRQRCTRLAFNPCSSATRATDVPGASHSARTLPFNSLHACDPPPAWLVPWCPPPWLVDTIVAIGTDAFKMTVPDRYDQPPAPPCPCLRSNARRPWPLKPSGAFAVRSSIVSPKQVPSLADAGRRSIRPPPGRPPVDSTRGPRDRAAAPRRARSPARPTMQA
jgi:hypothetical protein